MIIQPRSDYPERLALIVLETSFNQNFLGHYRGNGQYSIITRCELNDEGSYDRFFGTIHHSYVDGWAYVISQEDAEKTQIAELDQCVGCITDFNRQACEVCSYNK